MKKYKVVIEFHGKLDNNIQFVSGVIDSNPEYKCVGSELVGFSGGNLTVIVLKRKTFLEKLLAL